MKKELLTFRDPKSPVSEVFRTLRTNIQFMNTEQKLETLLVCSTSPGEGKSWVTSNLAITFAQTGKRVILVDADMRKGRQFKIFEVAPRPGLSNFLSECDPDSPEQFKSSIKHYLQETEVDNLSVLTAGQIPPNPAELLASRKMRRLLEGLKQLCEIVIIDGTPCDLVTDAVILSKFVDSTIIVTAQNETKKDSLSRIVKSIQNVGGKIAGVVVNKVPVSTKKYNESYYYGSIPQNSSNGSRKKSSSENRSSNYSKIRETENITSKTTQSHNPVKNNIEKHTNYETNKQIDAFNSNNNISQEKVDEIKKMVSSYIENKNKGQERKH